MSQPTMPTQPSIPSGSEYMSTNHVITWIIGVETSKWQTWAACGCFVCMGHSLRSIGCTPAVCNVQRCCSCSCHLWLYTSVMPLPYLFYLYQLRGKQTTLQRTGPVSMVLQLWLVSGWLITESDSSIQTVNIMSKCLSRKTTPDADASTTPTGPTPHPAQKIKKRPGRDWNFYTTLFRKVW